MNFMFELQEQLISRVSTTNKWDIVLATGTWNSYLWANELCSFYFIDILTMVFLKIFQRFPKILQHLSEGHTNVAGHFWNFRRSTKDQGRPKYVSIMH